MYLIFEGELEIGYKMLNNNSLSTGKYVKLVSNFHLINYIGDYYILFNEKSRYFYKAKTEIHAFGIDKNEFLNVIKKDEEFFNLFRLKAYNEHVKNLMDKKLKSDIERLNKTNNATNVLYVPEVEVI